MNSTRNEREKKNDRGKLKKRGKKMQTRARQSYLFDQWSFRILWHVSDDVSLRKNYSYSDMKICIVIYHTWGLILLLHLLLLCFSSYFFPSARASPYAITNIMFHFGFKNVERPHQKSLLFFKQDGNVDANMMLLLSINSCKSTRHKGELFVGHCSLENITILESSKTTQESGNIRKLFECIKFDKTRK